MAAEADDAGDRTFRPVRSADRTLDVLEALAEKPATLAELARRLAIPKSSLHGLLRTLTERHWVRFDADPARFRLGMRALHVGGAFVDSDDTVTRTAPVLDELAEATGETVQLARLDGASIIYLAKRDSAHQLRLISTVGTRLPAHATALGKAMLASRSDDEVRALLTFPLAALTPRTLTDEGRLLADLATTRRRGYAVDDEEAAEHLRCFAVAIPARGPATDAISVSVPAFRLTPDRETEITGTQCRLGQSLNRF